MIHLLNLLLASVLLAAPVPVQLQQGPDGQWQLLRGGQPFFIQGAGGEGSLELLAACGANSIRTWGVDEHTEALLDRADALGLTVVAGLWLGHTEHGFDYADSLMCARQRERVIGEVLRLREHPALLLWGLGNEMEGFAEGDDPAVWHQVQELARVIHQLDPHHPVMTVTAEIGGSRVQAVHEHCPDVDILGVNSYGGLPSLPVRYRELGGRKPLVITEFGPPGSWESARSPQGAPLELSSTLKAEAYRRGWEQGCLAAGDLCLGGFAFAWGSKVEATATWYGMFLASGERLQAVDEMRRLWSGQEPKNACPQILELTTPDAPGLRAGEPLRVECRLFDAEGDALERTWRVTQELPAALPGASLPPPFELADVLQAEDEQGARFLLPGGGDYRVYLEVRDGQGGAATANLPLHVEGTAGHPCYKMPIAVYSEGQPAPWIPSGWMGSPSALEMDMECRVSPQKGEHCLRFTYHEAGHWVGVAWQHPEGDWGDAAGGYDLNGARKLSFWARGEAGGERIEVALGLIGRDKPFHDTARSRKLNLRLKKKWKRYEIPLKGLDLSRVKTPFVWSMAGHGKPVTFYLDEIRFE